MPSHQHTTYFVLTCSWVECVTLGIIEKSELFDPLEQHVSLSLRREVILLQLFSQLFVVHNVEHKFRETFKTWEGGGGGGRGVATGDTGSGRGYLIEALVEVSVDEFLKDLNLANRARNYRKNTSQVAIYMYIP